MNDRLRRARLDAGLSQSELAEEVNRRVHLDTKRPGTWDAQPISRLERGLVRRPREPYLSALCAVLGGSPAELGLHHPPRVTVDDVDRQTFLKATLGAGAGALLAPVNRAALSDAELIAVLAGPTGNYRRMESAVPSDRLSDAVDAHLDLVATVIETRTRTSAGYRALSEVAGLAAWLAADRADNVIARRRYIESIRAANKTRHRVLVSYMTASYGQFAVEIGDVKSGLTMLGRAEAQLDDDAPDTAHAWLASLHAVAYAALGDRHRVVSELRRAEKFSARQRGEAIWPWIFTFDLAKAASYRAVALGRLGDVRAARTAYVAASSVLTSPKPRAMAQVEHAYVLARAGDVAGGCALAIEALTIGGAYRSDKIIARTRAFRATLPPRSTETADLDDAFNSLSLDS